MNANIITIDDTRFIYETNFAGNPAKDKFGDNRRKCNLVIPDPNQAKSMLDKGYKVKQTKPGPDDDPDDFVPTYFVQAVLKYRDRYGKELKYAPKVYLVNTDNEPVLLEEDFLQGFDRRVDDHLPALRSDPVREGDRAVAAVGFGALGAGMQLPE